MSKGKIIEVKDFSPVVTNPNGKKVKFEFLQICGMWMFKSTSIIDYMEVVDEYGERYWALFNRKFYDSFLAMVKRGELVRFNHRFFFYYDRYDDEEDIPDGHPMWVPYPVLIEIYPEMKEMVDKQLKEAGKELEKGSNREKVVKEI